jgi:hypothetical protein
MFSRIVLRVRVCAAAVNSNRSGCISKRSSAEEVIVALAVAISALASWLLSVEYYFGKKMSLMCNDLSLYARYSS